MLRDEKDIHRAERQLRLLAAAGRMDGTLTTQEANAKVIEVLEWVQGKETPFGVFISRCTSLDAFDQFSKNLARAEEN